MIRAPQAIRGTTGRDVTAAGRRPRPRRGTTARKTAPGGIFGRTYDVSSDGQRFLMIKAGGGADQATAPLQLILVQHFDEELKRLVPTQ